MKEEERKQRLIHPLLLLSVLLRKLSRSKASRSQRLVDDLHQLDRLFLLPMPSNDLNPDRQSFHLLRVVDPSEDAFFAVDATFDERSAGRGALARPPGGGEGVEGRIDEGDGDETDGGIDDVPKDRSAAGGRVSMDKKEGQAGE
jgi:hypothetical protein